MKKLIIFSGVLLALYLTNNDVTACQVTFKYEPNVTVDLMRNTTGYPVSFYGTSDGLNYQWLWNFGDGTTDTVQNPIHLFKNPGVYYVTLKAWPDKCVVQYSDSIKIPIFNSTGFNYQIHVNENFEINLPSNPSTGYSWVWTNKHANSIVDSIGFTYTADKPVLIGSGGTEQWTFRGTRIGIDTIIMNYKRVWEKNGDVPDSKSFIINVIDSSNVSTCKADFSYISDLTLIYCKCAGVYTFKDLSKGQITKWSWNFGDGTTASDPNTTHTFSSYGVYNVRLDISGQEGCNSSITKTIYATNNYDTCNVRGIFHASYYNKCSYPIITADSQNYVIIRGNTNGIPDGANIIFGYTEDPTMSAYSKCGKGNDKYVLLTCIHVLDSIIPPDSGSCVSTGTYWQHVKDSLGRIIACAYPIIKSDDGKTLLVLDTSYRNIPDGSKIKFGGYYDYSKILRFNCTPYEYAINLNCITLLDSITPVGCNFYGTVIDSSGYYIRLDNGLILKPYKVDQPFTFYNTQRVKLSYNTLAYMNSCWGCILAEITCIEEIFNKPPDACKIYISFTTNTIIGSNACNGSAIAKAYSPIISWNYIMCDSGKNCIAEPVTYSYLWSTGDTGTKADNLCPNKLYSLIVTDIQHNCSITSVFSLFQTSEINTSWTYQKIDSQYYFSIPITNGYYVTWTFDDGTVMSGTNISKSVYQNGQHNVLLKVYDSSNNIVYSQLIPLNEETLIKESTVSNYAISVYPVPADKILNLRFIAPANKEGFIDIIDLFGRIVYSTSLSVIRGENIKTIPIDALSNGVYTGRISFSGSYSRFKFLK